MQTANRSEVQYHGSLESSHPYRFPLQRETYMQPHPHFETRVVPPMPATSLNVTPAELLSQISASNHQNQRYENPQRSPGVQTTPPSNPPGGRHPYAPTSHPSSKKRKVHKHSDVVKREDLAKVSARPKRTISLPNTPQPLTASVAQARALAQAQAAHAHAHALSESKA
eukprot:scaffold1519_cov37-Prasinocladus_malaysianus.AAC.1